jgi:hypothetical protein
MSQPEFNAEIKNNHQDRATNQSPQLHVEAVDSILLIYKI